MTAWLGILYICVENPVALGLSFDVTIAFHVAHICIGQSLNLFLIILLAVVDFLMRTSTYKEEGQGIIGIHSDSASCSPVRRLLCLT